jgi:hypothetical protein
MVLALSVPMLALNAAAWEFDATGAFTYEYNMATQGELGFFGRHNTVVPTYTGANAAATRQEIINFWTGAQFPERDGSGNVIYRTVATKKAESIHQSFVSDIAIKINPALSIHGRYTIGSWAPATPADGISGNVQGVANSDRYYVKTSGDIFKSISPGYWNYLRIKAKLPFANMSLGKRGTGQVLGWNAEGFIGQSESISLSVPYGPLSLGISTYIRPVGGYYNGFDGANTRRFQLHWGPAYSAGPLSMGLGFDHIYRFQGAERAFWEDGADRNSVDRAEFAQNLFIQYNNGRFFFNGHGYHYNRIYQVQATNAIDRDDLYRDSEIWTYGVELGTFIGPSKLSLIYLHATGQDRRGLADERGTLFKDNRITVVADGVTGAFLPYTALMGPSYAFGTASFHSTGVGRLDSGTFVGARLDYAVAANLNVYGAYSRFYQPYKAYGWGYLRPMPQGADEDADGEADYLGGQVVAGFVEGTTADINDRARAIPVDDVGWEFMVGVDWQLLEGLVFGTKFAYFQPGEWFKYAAIDKSLITDWQEVIDADNPAVIESYVNPGREIDPVLGLVMNMNFEF